MSYACPSCGTPLDTDGICPSCGALSRGLFHGLDLGPPQLADAVRRGLDFYRLLELDPACDTRTAARRYRQLRARFPDDRRTLDPQPAQRLALLEAAGRTLTDPALRAVYDDLRRDSGANLDLAADRCVTCAAPLLAGAQSCRYCGTPRPVAAAAPTAPPAPGELPPASEPQDYYALLGVTPTHLIPGVVDQLSRLPPGPPDADDVDLAARQRQSAALLRRYATAEQREQELDVLEIARLILRQDRTRGVYDALWLAFQRGQLGGGRLDALASLEAEARATIAAERGDAPLEDGGSVLSQGLGLLRAGLAGDALAPLRRAVQQLPDSAEAHAALAQALLNHGDPLDLGGHALREAERALARCAALGAAQPNGPALQALVAGLLARDGGDPAGAARELQRAADLDQSLGAAWRSLAALAAQRKETAACVSACHHALAANSADQRALLIMAGALLRAGRRSEAREPAAALAALRGAGWSAERVLADLG